MDKQIEEYILDLEEVEAYRSLEGVPFDFGTGLIENDLGMGTEEAIWEMDQQDLEEIVHSWNYEKMWNNWLKSKNKKRKYKLNRYYKKKIDKAKKKKLAEISWFPVYYDEHKQRYVHTYLSGCRKYAKWCTNRKVRNTNDFSLKGSGYRKTFDYWWTLF
jgi:hypothetical protein